MTGNTGNVNFVSVQKVYKKGLFVLIGLQVITVLTPHQLTAASSSSSSCWGKKRVCNS